MKKCASPDAFNVYGTKGSGRRRGLSKGKNTDKKAASHSRVPQKAPSTGSSSLIRASPLQKPGLEQTKSMNTITHGIFAGQQTVASKPSGPMISRNMVANRNTSTQGKIQQPN